MKKTIAIAIFVAIGSVASAASINWSVTAGPNMAGMHLKNSTGGVYTGTAYLILAANSADVIAALGAGESFSYLDSNKTTAPITGALAAKDLTNDALTTTATGFQILLVDGTGDNQVYLLSSVKSITPSGDVTSPAVLSFTAATDFKGEWAKASSGTTGDVPEPTSGLLLLVGAAALALKRKQA